MIKKFRIGVKTSKLEECFHYHICKVKFMQNHYSTWYQSQSIKLSKGPSLIDL
jgi:hypothetical protein